MYSVFIEFQVIMAELQLLMRCLSMGPENFGVLSGPDPVFFMPVAPVGYMRTSCSYGIMFSLCPSRCLSRGKIALR